MVAARLVAMASQRQFFASRSQVVEGRRMRPGQGLRGCARSERPPQRCADKTLQRARRAALSFCLTSAAICSPRRLLTRPAGFFPWDRISGDRYRFYSTRRRRYPFALAACACGSLTTLFYGSSSQLDMRLRLFLRFALATCNYGSQLRFALQDADLFEIEFGQGIGDLFRKPLAVDAVGRFFGVRHD